MQSKLHQLAEKQKILLPYRRYLAVLPTVEKEKREEAARIDAENKKRQLCPEASVVTPVDVKVIKKESDNLYKMPIKEILKRKYEESVATKAANAASAKRIKTEENSDNKLKFVNLPPTKKELRQQNQRDAATVSVDGNEQQMEADSDDGPPDEKPTSSRPIDNNNCRNQLKKPKHKNNKRGKFRNAGRTHQQSSDKPVATNFDYQNVDFKKFQGGAQKAKGTELKPQFHGKVILNSNNFVNTR